MSPHSRQVAAASAPAPAAAAMPSSSVSGELSLPASAAPHPSPSLIDPAQALKASRALLAHLKSAAAAAASSSSTPKKRNLLADADPADDDSANPAAAEPIWLVFAAKNHLLASNRLKPVQLAVPHPIIDPLAAPAGALRIALIVAEPQRAMKDLVASAGFPADLRACISRVIDYTHLGKKFKSYEAQRILFSNHDIFLADDRISNRLVKLLGTRFFKTTTKRPIPVAFYARSTASGSGGGKRTSPKPKRDASTTLNLRPVSQIAAEIGRACGAALAYLGPSSSTSVVIGRGSWPAEHVAANAVAVAETLTARFAPQGDWAGVSSVFIKGTATVALPVWQTDALWAQQSQVLPDDPPTAETGGGVVRAAEKANVGRKRKAISEAASAPVPVVTGGPARKRKAASGADEPSTDGEAVVVKKKKKTVSRRTAKAVAA